MVNLTIVCFKTVFYFLPILAYPYSISAQSQDEEQIAEQSNN